MKVKFVVSGIVCWIAFTVVDALRQTPTDWSDGFVSHGFPFTYSRTGGFVGRVEIVWGGVIGDMVAVVVGAVVIACVWEFLARKISTRPTTGK